ncbi:PDZ domain-containing protein [Aphelenchoides fujianensis]|nr:PDZ domain-containing protein [Aphelenchoides fujianensis]
MVNQPSAVPEPPRVCVIRKAHAGQEYGFNLHSERTHQQYVGAVDPNSPADRGGLRQGDRIIGVNGAIIVGETHKEVVQKIKQNPMQCEMLVISEEGPPLARAARRRLLLRPAEHRAGQRGRRFEFGPPPRRRPRRAIRPPRSFRWPESS